MRPTVASGLRRLALRHDGDRCRRARTKIEVYGGTVIGPPSPSTGCPVPVVSWPVGIHLQIAGARVRFLAVRALHGDPARAVDRDVEIAAGRSAMRRDCCPSPRCALVA